MIITSSKNPEIKLLRDFDRKNANPIEKAIFDLYDKDRSGNFDDKEYSKYLSDCEKREFLRNKAKESREELDKNPTPVVKHYKKELDNIEKEFKKLEEKRPREEFIEEWNKCFEELSAFEKTHQVALHGYTDKSELPKDAKIYDISAFGIGIYDSEGYNTGKCYKKGYLEGFEKLSPEEKEKYLELLENATELIEESKELEDKLAKLSNEYDKHIGLLDLAYSGQIKEVCSNDKATQYYNEWANIRDNCNPYLKRIKELEMLITKLQAKGSHMTKEDFNQCGQYLIEHQHLIEASRNTNWSIAETDKKINTSTGELKRAISWLNPAFYRNDKNNEVTFSNTERISFNSNTSNTTVGTDISLVQTYKNNEINHSGNGSFYANYKKGNSYISFTSNTSVDKTMLNNMNVLSLGNEKLGVSLEKNFSKLYEGNSKLVDNTKLGITYNEKQIFNTASIQFAGNENIYTLSSSANLPFKLTDETALNISPSIQANYYSGSQNYNIGTNFNTNVSYKKEDFALNLFASEQLSISNNTPRLISNSGNMTVSAQNNSTSINHNLSLNTGMQYKNFKADLNFNDSDTPYSHSNTYGIGLSHQNANQTVKLSYFYQNSKQKGVDSSCTESHNLEIAYGIKFGNKENSKNIEKRNKIDYLNKKQQELLIK